MAEPTSPFCELRAFRAELHACLLRRADALFDLCDALLCAEVIPSLAHLSLQPPHQRGWGSTYAALAHGRVDLQALRNLLARYPLHDSEPIYAVDVSTWPRCDAETSPERGFYYHPSRHSAGQPIVAGWAFQWICPAQLRPDSWTAPLDVQRVHPTAKAKQVAVEPDPARSSPAAGRRAGALVRVRRRLRPAAHSASAWPRCPPRSWSGSAPGAASTPTRHRVLRPAQGGRPRRHGAKFDYHRPGQLAGPDR